jgi:hypothetical protein
MSSSTLNEVWHDGGFLVSEANGHQSRDQVTVGGAIIPPPANPVTNTIAGGALAATTYYVKTTYVGSPGETTPSAEVTQAAAINTLLTVSSPAAQAGANGYNVYVSTATGTETKQNAAPVPIGSTWTEPVSGLVAGAPVPAANTTTSKVYAGTVLGQITATSVWVPLAPAASDGSQTAAGILFGTRDCTGGNQQGVVVNRNAEINGSELLWPSSATPAQITAAIGQLKTIGVIVR